MNATPVAHPTSYTARAHPALRGRACNYSASYDLPLRVADPHEPAQAKDRGAPSPLLGLAVGVLAVRGVSAGGSGGATRTAPLAAPSRPIAPLRDGSTSKFRFLAGQTSNRCNLQPGALVALPARMRLQGSCCAPMDLAAYQKQVRGLRTYRRTAEIPSDPYDVPVSLAKRLLAYDRAIHLTPGQAWVYRQAMRMSHQKGPCCCRCWRWLPSADWPSS